MEKFVIDGGIPLSGTVVPAGNKNAALPCLAASALTAEEVVVRNVPRIRDVQAMLDLLEHLGATVEWRGEHEVAICAAGDHGRRRSSTRACRPASARRSCSPGRCWRASVAPTCRRPAATSSAAAGSIRTSTPSARSARGSSVTTTRSLALAGELRAGEVFMDEPSVMGTENALLAAALTPGETADLQRGVRAARRRPRAHARQDGRRHPRASAPTSCTSPAPTCSAARRTTSGPTTSRSARSWRWPA